MRIYGYARNNICIYCLPWNIGKVFVSDESFSTPTVSPQLPAEKSPASHSRLDDKNTVRVSFGISFGKGGWMISWEKKSKLGS